MTHSTLANILWAAGFVGHAVLFLILILRRRWREFPIFTALVAFQVLRTLLLLLFFRYSSQHAYFVAYWSTGAADYCFQVGLIYEIARDVLRPTGRWIQDARKAFVLWGSLGCAGAGIFALFIGPPEAKGLDLWDVRLTVFTSLLTCELFLAMSAAANRLGLQRRSHVIAIGQGITVWAFTTLMEDFGHVLLGWNRDFALFATVRMVVYLGVLAYWTMAFWLPEQGRAPLSPEMNAYLVALHRRVDYDLSSFDGPHL